jgi:N4-gp56 family major capsid protein
MATSFTRVITTPGGAASNPALIPQYWGQKTFKEAFEKNPLTRFMGKGSDAIIQVKMDLAKVQGDKVTFGIRNLLTGSGQTDDGTYEGNEEGMNFDSFALEIHEHGHSVQLAGNMTEKSAAMNLRTEAKDALSEWKGRIVARGIIDALSGLKGHAFTGQVLGASALLLDAGNNQINTVQQVAPTRSATAKRYYCGGQTTAGEVTRVADPSDVTTAASCLMGTKVIEAVKRMAKLEVASDGTHITPIRPIRIGGDEVYVLLVDPLQVKSLRADSDWKAAMQNAYIRGKDNPFFSGALAYWDGVAIFETQMLHRRTGAGGVTGPEYFDSTTEALNNGITMVRSLFLGAQSVCLAYGKMPVWTEGHLDWQKTRWGFHTNWIYGMKKVARYSSANVTSMTADSEFGCIIVDTAVT